MSIIVRKKGWSSPNCLDVRKYYVYTTNQFLTMKIGGGQAGQF